MAEEDAEFVPPATDMDAFCMWFEQQRYEQAHAEFVTAHAAHFDGATADGEQRLEWTQLYNEYTAIFDVQLESFVEERGTTVPEFLAAAQGEEGLASLYISLILASTEYDAFVGMMALRVVAVDDFGGRFAAQDPAEDVVRVRRVRRPARAGGRRRQPQYVEERRAPRDAAG